MTSKQTVVLITGANSGIGHELAAQLIEDPTKHVILGSRSLEKGNVALDELKSRGHKGGVQLIQLDVTSEQSIDSAAEEVLREHGYLDVLVNNAAIGWPGGSKGEAMAKCLQTNATGPYLVTEAFVPLLLKSEKTPRIINVTSGAGSVARRMDPAGPSYNLGMKGIEYGASKAAMNLITAYQAVVYGEQGIKVCAVSPGFVVSSLGPQNNAENGAMPTSLGAAPIVGIINGERDAESPRNGFLRAKGQSPW